MIEQIYTYFTIDMLYYWVNLGVLPLWLILIFFPTSSLCRYFVTSIFPFIILSGAYIFLLYKSYLSSYDFDSNFSLYLGIDDTKDLFSSIPLIILYLIGPLGLLVYWLIRIFYAKNIS